MNMQPRKHGWQSRAASAQDSIRSPSSRTPSHPSVPRWPLIPCYANTIGPKIIFGSDYAIGGADGVLSRGMQWQGMSFWMTLRYGPTKAVTSSRIPTMPGKLFFMQELAGPLCADTN